MEVRYRGRVQGVGFRATVSGIARRHPVSGWVRNEHDGSVLLTAEGDEPALDAFLLEIHNTMARFIQTTDRATTTAHGEQGFEIRR